ncbi:hypothetical protein [Candidatus Nitrosopumilus sp. SW]|nr:hypothetical protein [Candidatus Nitrosopumilus sp. SW]
MAYRVINPEKCTHSISLKMPGLKNKRECMMCHKIFDEQGSDK